MKTTRQKIEIAERFRKARIQRDLSQQDLADELEIHRETVTYIESSTRSIRAEELGLFAKELGVTVEWLVG
jgi:transcriptional regulator with XRE-family HTH domain